LLAALAIEVIQIFSRSADWQSDDMYELEDWQVHDADDCTNEHTHDEQGKRALFWEQEVVMQPTL